MSKKSQGNRNHGIQTNKQLANHLATLFSQEFAKRYQKPEIGDCITATYTGGYTVEAHCIEDPGVLLYDPKKGKPFVLAISVLGPDGKPLMENGKLAD